LLGCRAATGPASMAIPPSWRSGRSGIERVAAESVSIGQRRTPDGKNACNACGC
jgi:hypothetical protein